MIATAPAKQVTDHGALTLARPGTSTEVRWSCKDPGRCGAEHPNSTSTSAVWQRFGPLNNRFKGAWNNSAWSVYCSWMHAAHVTVRHMSMLVATSLSTTADHRKPARVKSPVMRVSPIWKQPLRDDFGRYAGRKSEAKTPEASEDLGYSS